MLQSGILTKNLGTTWVSSLSWYFLNLFGLQSLFTLLLGNDNNTMDMQQLQPMMPTQHLDVAKLSVAELKSLELATYVNKLDALPIRIVQGS